MNVEKNEAIKTSLKETKERRKTQTPAVYEMKLQNLTDKDIETLERLFLEAKWLRNYVVSDIANRLNKDTWKVKEVEIKVKDKFEKREITHLGSQIKQEIVNRVGDDLKALHNSKAKGNKVGTLKFKSEVNSIPLKQYGNTYGLDFKHNRVHIQTIKKKFRVLGLHQILDDVEFAKGELIRKPSGYYLYVTVYLNERPTTGRTKKGTAKEKKAEHFNKPLGIDFGIKNELTLSNGIQFQFEVKESKKLKLLQKKLSKKQGFKKGERKSKNFFKTLNKIRREYERLFNIRKDIENRIFAFIRLYERVYTQDDNIKGWHSGLFGKQIQSTSIGRIKARLSNNLETLVLVDRFLPTTQTCSHCLHKQRISLSDRVFKCESCGFEIDRDINSARDMVLLGKNSPKNLPVDCWEVTPPEREASARILESNPYIRVSYTSVNEEAPSFN